MANNENVNKVNYNNNVLIDLTEDSVVPEAMLAGYTAHDKSGKEIAGSLEIATLSEFKTYLGIN